MKLNEIADKKEARSARKRLGRGIGSGSGKTSGRGHKGQKARSGVAIKGYEGGQMPIHRRLPKRGFHNLFRTEYEIVNLSQLQAAVDKGMIDADKPVTAETLRDAGLVKLKKDGIKLLAKGELKSKLNLEVAKASAAAKTAVEKTGGSVTVSAAAPAKDS